jgi:hypothetical protein
MVLAGRLSLAEMNTQRFFGIDKLEQPSILAFSQSVFRFVTVFGSSILIGSPITLGSAFTY